MLRFLSNYLFQNENQPNENDPTTTSSDEQQQGPTSNCKQPPPNDDDLKCDELNGGATKEEFMDLEMKDDGEDDGDWVLIGEKKRAQEEEKKEKKEVVVKEDLRVQVQPVVALVAAPSTEDEDDDEELDEEEEEVEQTHGLIWENKLIEHPSMSVYVDLATSINSNAVTESCVSLSSIAPNSSSGDSVIVLEQPDSDEEEDSDDDSTESMDFLESIVQESPVSLPQLQTAEQVHLADEEDPSDTENTHVPKTTAAPRPVVPTPPVQNGRRKKGHYPCSSSNSSQMPRRAHLRNSGGSNTTTSSSFNNGASPADASLDAIKRAKRSGATTNAAVSTSGIGITLVNGTVPTPPTSNGMANKNLKLVEMFPTASNSAKRRHRHQPPQKAGATPKGHFLQEAKRRQDLQNHTKHSFVNNDRRSATQRRVQKNAGGAAAATHNGGGRAGK